MTPPSTPTPNGDVNGTGGDELSLHSSNSGGSSSSGASRSGAGQSTSNATSASAQELIEEQKRMFQEESRQVARLKRAVLLIMLLAAVAVSTAVYFITKNSQTEQFEAMYEGAAEKLLATFHEIATTRLGAVSSLSVAATAHALDQAEPWPFMTLSWFQHRALTTRALSGALLLTLDPLVAPDERTSWEDYSFNSDAATWHQDDLDYQKQLNYGAYGVSFDLDHVAQRVTRDADLNISSGLANYIFTLDDAGEAVIDRSPGPYLPCWETSPVFIRTLVNRNLLTDPAAAGPANASITTGTVVFGGFEFAPDDLGTGNEPPETKLYTTLLSISKKRAFPYITSPVTRVYLPVYDTFNGNTRKPVALMSALFRWESYFVGVLPEQIRGIYMVLKDTCGDVYTFKIDDGEPDPVGLGDQHDHQFHELGRMASFEDVDTADDGSPDGIPLSHDFCTYEMTSYPNQIMQDDYQTNLPALITFAVAMVFIFTFAMFLVYDRLVERRQQLVLRRAEQTTAIVQSLFPKNVADKLIQEKSDPFASKTQRLSNFLKGEEEGTGTIADLFPECTVLFADIAGFTAWASSRDPTQVFHLLESIYNAFDEIAKMRKVFKVETVGDCYVAVTGLPDPQPQHMVVMARFAIECMIKMKEVTSNLETTLGPDTADLVLRIGMHSGPVTAGVLRGEKSRFQLFGDTVNTASRMESTGVRERIQISQDTASLLKNAGKGHWLTPREDVVNAKGKGVLQTFWLRTQSKRRTGSLASSGAGTHTSSNDTGFEVDIPSVILSEEILKRDRKVDWMAELLTEYLKRILAKRRVAPPLNGHQSIATRAPDVLIGINEIIEAIQLPEFDAETEPGRNDWQLVEVEQEVLGQLREYVAVMASKYRDNPFHNFEHACHVTMSVSKHLKRIVTPDLEINEVEMEACSKDKGAAMALLHDYTHGINSDPITHFAIVFSGLIHDVDHRGISNMQLEKEETALAERYKHKSLAEQNSLEIAWTVLLSDQFKELRQCLFATEEDLQRFRQVMVNAVMATDIFDKELNAARKARWERAFAAEADPSVDRNALRATIVLEHIIQASDVAHTMQHWHIYRKWNRLLFQELTLAFRAGRMAVDPATFWYKGELGFFDSYIIPLAKKLKDCKVFGVNSDECLNYAMRNRAEWEARGEETVATLVREFDDDDTES